MFKTYLQKINNQLIHYRVSRAIDRWRKRYPFSESVRTFAKREEDTLMMIFLFEDEEGDVLDHLILEFHKDGRKVLRK